MVKRYLELMKDYVSTGRAVEYHRDPFDRPTMMLGWDSLEKTKLREPRDSPKLSDKRTASALPNKPKLSGSYPSGEEDQFCFSLESPGQSLMNSRAQLPAQKQEGVDGSPTPKIHVTAALENQRPGLPWEWKERVKEGKSMYANALRPVLQADCFSTTRDKTSEYSWVEYIY